MEIIRTVNAELSKLEDGKMTRFLDLGKKFFDSSGRIPNEVMYDQLHPTVLGDKIWAEAMNPLLEEMMAPPHANPPAVTALTLGAGKEVFWRPGYGTWTN